MIQDSKYCYKFHNPGHRIHSINLGHILHVYHNQNLELVLLSNHYQANHIRQFQ